MNFAPVQMFHDGYTDLISVIPPDAPLSPGSKITPDQRGKVPGRKLSNGTWAGYDWRKAQARSGDVMAWITEGANVGTRAGRFPGLDIDSMDEAIAHEIETIALHELGPAPVRIGKPPKRLLMYRTDKPFMRMRLWLDKGDGVQHLIEMLGEGQQYLVYGVHPATRSPYRWSVAKLPAAKDLTLVTADKVEQLFDRIAVVFGAQGYHVSREGDGKRQERNAPGNQDDLKAPSDEELGRAMSYVPNTDAQFPTREDYIKVGYAIRAASRDQDEGLAIFSEWASRWENPKGNSPDTVQHDWKRMKPPYSIGWNWIAQLAREYGYSNAAESFTAEGLAPDSPAIDESNARVKYTERWLAEQVIDKLGGTIRYAAEIGRWLVWDGHRWRPDDLQAVKAQTSDVLHQIAVKIATEARGGPHESKAEGEVKRIEATHTLFDVLRQVQAHRSIAVPATALDADPWLLNTPGGVVDLRTGNVTQSQPDQLSTKLTRVGPDFEAPAPEFERFLKEATGDDPELYDYLQRYAGYMLTGSVREETILFVYGPTMRGKSKFANALLDVMGDYGKMASMDTFIAAKFDKHSTDLASLMGARLVLASETQEGRRWDEQRLKQLTGGDPITARFMRQDNFTYRPQFKLFFLGNAAPKVRDVGNAVRRRLHVVPFVVEPRVRDNDLPTKLAKEYPQILAWMIRGALKWQTRGTLDPPQRVLDYTADYFEEQDAVGKWLEEYTEPDEMPGAGTEIGQLFSSWREWGNANGEHYPANSAALSQQLVSRGFQRSRNSSGRSVIRGIRVRAVAPEKFA